jgi:hypothetical protein
MVEETNEKYGRGVGTDSRIQLGDQLFIVNRLRDVKLRNVIYKMAEKVTKCLTMYRNSNWYEQKMS